MRNGCYCKVNMDSVLMSPPSNNTRMSTRLPRAATTILVRNSKQRNSGRSNSFNNKNCAKHCIKQRPQRNAQLCRNNSIKSRNIKTVTNDKLNNNGNILQSPNIVKVPENSSFTREVYDVIFGRLGPTLNIPGEFVQALFNDLQLYPSKKEVSEMLQVASKCSGRTGSTLYLTGAELCLCAREMQQLNSIRHIKTSPPKANKCTKCEVFLGGSCNPTTWRTDIAIPELRKYGITYYNPQVSIWAPELVDQEHAAKQSASVLLYVVDSQTRSVAGMIEVAYLVAAGRCVVLVAYPYNMGQSIMGEPISEREYLDLVNGQISLLALVKSQGIKVHNNLSSALQCTANLLRNSGSNGMFNEEEVSSRLRTLRDVFDTYDKNNSGDLDIDSALKAYKTYTNKSLDKKCLSAYLLKNVETDVRISFDQFCAVVAEYNYNENCTGSSLLPEFGSYPNTIDWKGTLLKTRHMLQTYIAQPIVKLIDYFNQPLKRQCSTKVSKDLSNPKYMNGTSYYFDIYLGGSCSTKSLWRDTIAIPLIKKYGLKYYNPAIRETNFYESDDDASIYDSFNSEESILHHKQKMDKSKALLFVITSDTRSLTTMILAAHYIGLQKDVVLCIENLPLENLNIHNEKLSEQAIKDYNRGRVYLKDLAVRKKIEIHEEIGAAVQSAINKCQAR